MITDKALRRVGAAAQCESSSCGFLGSPSLLTGSSRPRMSAHATGRGHPRGPLAALQNRRRDALACVRLIGLPLSRENGTEENRAHGPRLSSRLSRDRALFRRRLR